MGLRTRVLLWFGVTTVAVVLGLHLLFDRMLLPGYAGLERQDIIMDVERADHALAQLANDLHDRAVDWSSWDDTYAFMADGNQAYITSNLLESSLARMKLDMVLLVDPRLQIRRAVPVRRQPGVAPPDAAELLAAIRGGSAPTPFDRQPDGFCGLVGQRSGPMNVSARPIRTSSNGGPSRGWLLFVRRFDGAELARLAERTRLQISVEDVSSAALSPDRREALTHLAAPGSIRVQTQGEEGVAGYTSIRDLHGRALSVMRVRDPRAIYAQGIRTMRYLTRVTAAAAFMFSLVTLLFLERFVLSRISRLGGQVRGIGRGQGAPARVSLPGRDELALLADTINRMLEAQVASGRRLKESEERLRAYSADLEQVVQERTREIEHQAFHDALTGLPNRALFMDRLETAQARSVRADRGVAVIFLDLDNFKVINDSQGHDAGDTLLTAVAARLHSALRAGDTIARLGGDEFTILVEDLASPGEAVDVAERLLASLHAPIRLRDGEAFAAASMGIAFSYGAQSPPIVLLQNADVAMYRAKASGKGGYCVFDQSMNDMAVERMEIEGGLRVALEQHELRVHYQPLLDLATGRVSGVEALVRWQHPTRGLISPGAFVPIAEETGLIVPIGYWVLEEACRQTRAWHDRYADENPLVVNVNLSGKQLQREDLVRRVGEILERTAIRPEYVKLEITESVLMADLDEAAGRLRELKGLGVKLAIDDFGTGYSSIASLSRFPIDTVKIDQSFIRRVDGSEDGAGVVGAIIMLARTLQMTVTGEGVETPEQVAHLQALGCDTGQGYLFSRPVSALVLDEQLKAGRQVLVPTTSGLQKETIEELLDTLASSRPPDDA